MSPTVRLLRRHRPTPPSFLRRPNRQQRRYAAFPSMVNSPTMHGWTKLICWRTGSPPVPSSAITAYSKQFTLIGEFFDASTNAGELRLAGGGAHAGKRNVGACARRCPGRQVPQHSSWGICTRRISPRTRRQAWSGVDQAGSRNRAFEGQASGSQAGAPRKRKDLGQYGTEGGERLSRRAVRSWAQTIADAVAGHDQCAEKEGEVCSLTQLPIAAV